MFLFLQALPLLTLVGLLASGRAGPLLACAVALAATLPAALLTFVDPPAVAAWAGRSVAEGAWLALIPIGITVAGLVFHAVVGAGEADATGAAGGGSVDKVDLMFTAGFLLGPFTEAVTGFGVGTVFAIGVMRRAGIPGAPAAAVGSLAQLMVPWGGLGPGTAIGAALAGVPAQQIAHRNALQLAAMLVGLLPLFWWWCALAGHRVRGRARLDQALWVGGLAALLVGLHRLVPWEVCGLLATGPLLAARVLLATPPRGRAGWRRAVGRAFPYVLLAGVLVGSRIWADPPAWHPYPGLPGLPLNHAVVGLSVVACLLLAARRDAAALAGAALRRAPLPVLALLLYVVFARVLSNAGIPQALAGALAGLFGGLAPYAGPLMAAVAGFVAGTNTGSNSAMMPLQAALGRASGLAVAVLPAVQNGTPVVMCSPQRIAIAVALAGDTTPGALWRLVWPVAAIGIAVGLAAVAIG